LFRPAPKAAAHYKGERIMAGAAAKVVEQADRSITDPMTYVGVCIGWVEREYRQWLWRCAPNHQVLQPLTPQLPRHATQQADVWCQARGLDQSLMNCVLCIECADGSYLQPSVMAALRSRTFLDSPISG
jgi:hypothetical protein